MHVLDLDNQWTLLTPFEAHLFQRLERAGSDRLWCECGNGFRPLFHPEQLKEIGGRCLSIHPNFSQRHVHLLGHRLRTIGLADTTSVAEHIDNWMVRNSAPIGEAASFEIGDPLVLKSMPKFVQQ